MRIVVIGDHDPANPTHRATTAALGHSASVAGEGDAAVAWLRTDAVGDPAASLAEADGVLVAPGSPYADMEGAVRAIEHARTGGVPLLGTCGGLQHLVVEYARNVLGVRRAAHAEYLPEPGPGAADDPLFITPLSCSLAGRTMDVTLVPGSQVASAYGASSATERYYCNFGIAPARVAELEAAGLRASAVDALGEVRAVELPDLPFYVGTLFVPQASSTPERPHPLVTALVTAAERARR